MIHRCLRNSGAAQGRTLVRRIRSNMLGSTREQGASPAMGVRLHHWFHLLSPVHSHSIHAQQRIADLLKELPAQARGLLLFPGQTHISDVEFPISRSEIDKSIEDIKPKKHFFPELIR